MLGRIIRDRFGPAEPYEFWEAHSPGFRRPKRDLVATDVTPDTVCQLHNEFEFMQTVKRHRWLFKSRVGRVLDS